jgi:adenosyl cobinamide kinase/adenosyl cobinamide phosphate guanylyltransferase
MSNQVAITGQINDQEMLKRLHAFTSRRGSHPAQVDGFLAVAQLVAVGQPTWVGGIKYNDKANALVEGKGGSR